MNEEAYSLFASMVPKDARIAFESTIMAYPISRALRKHGYSDITVAHPRELTWIVRSKKKNDRVDSLKIAKLHMIGMLPESHLLDRDKQVVRDLLVQRVKLGVEIGEDVEADRGEGRGEEAERLEDRASVAFNLRQLGIIAQLR
jgi:hypothetical protein